MSAATRLDSLSDLVKHKANLRVTCRTCEKGSVIDAHWFARYCLLRCWNSQLEALAPRLLCSRCGARGAHVSWFQATTRAPLKVASASSRLDYRTFRRAGGFSAVRSASG